MRPFVFVNLAMSADGKISTVERKQVRISGPADRERVDRLKAGADAIMVGIGTVLADNPSLTVKSEILKEERRTRGLVENPVRVVIDSRARIPIDAEILHKGPGKRIVAVTESADHEKVTSLSRWAEVISAGEREVDLAAVLEMLWEYGIRRIMVEGGGTLIGALMREHLVDELYTYVGNLVIGGSEAPTPADGTGFLKEEEFLTLTLLEVTPLDQGVLIHWKV